MGEEGRSDTPNDRERSRALSRGRAHARTRTRDFDTTPSRRDSTASDVRPPSRRHANTVFRPSLSFSPAKPRYRRRRRRHPRVVARVYGGLNRRHRCRSTWCCLYHPRESARIRYCTSLPPASTAAITITAAVAVAADVDTTFVIALVRPRARRRCRHRRGLACHGERARVCGVCTA